MLMHVVKKTLGSFLLQQIELESNRTDRSAGLLDDLVAFFFAFRLVAAGDNQVGAQFSERLADGSPQIASAASNDGCLSFQGEQLFQGFIHRFALFSSASTTAKSTLSSMS